MPCQPLQNTGRTGTLTINSRLLNGPAWDIPHLETLWANTALRGANRRVSGNPGNRALRRRYDETLHQLPMIVIGHYTPAGVAVANAVTGLATNLETLRTDLINPIVTGDDTLSASLTIPGLTTRTAEVQPDLVVGEMQAGRIIGGVATVAMVRCVLKLTIPLGRFT